MHRKHRSNCQALLLPTGEPHRRALFKARKADGSERSAYSWWHLLVRHTEVFKPKRNLLGCADLAHLKFRIIEDDANGTCHFTDRCGCGVESFDSDLPLIDAHSALGNNAINR